MRMRGGGVSKIWECCGCHMCMVPRFARLIWLTGAGGFPWSNRTILIPCANFPILLALAKTLFQIIVPIPPFSTLGLADWPTALPIANITFSVCYETISARSRIRYAITCLIFSQTFHVCSRRSVSIDCGRSIVRVCGVWLYRDGKKYVIHNL